MLKYIDARLSEEPSEGVMTPTSLDSSDPSNQDLIKICWSQVLRSSVRIGDIEVKCLAVHLY